MKIDLNPAPLSTDRATVRISSATDCRAGRLGTENAQLRAEIEEFKRKNARLAAPFSKKKRKMDPKRSGCRGGQRKFRDRMAPLAEDCSDTTEDVPVKEIACPECCRDSIEDGQEVFTNTKIPPAPISGIKSYRYYGQTSYRRQRKVIGRHPTGQTVALTLNSQLKKADELY